MIKTNEVATVVAGFRRAADLLEAHPQIAKPTVTDEGQLRWWLYAWECPDGIPAMVAAIRRAVGGKWDKRETTDCVGQSEMVFECDGYAITVKRDAVCTRRVVGTETVILPAIEAKPESTVERDIVEWDCEPILEAASA